MNDFNHLNNTVFCKLGISPIHGVGVFAIRDIKKGTALSDYTLKDFKHRTKYTLYCMTPDEFKQILPEVRALILDRMIFHSRYNANYFEFISPNNNAVLQSFMNHSTDPNSDGEYATRDIKAGEEVTENFRSVTGHLMHDISEKHFTFL